MNADIETGRTVAGMRRFIDTRYVQAAVVVFLLGWALTGLVHDGRLLVRGYTPLPFWDHWRAIEHYPAYKNLQLSVFFRQQNEHRVVFPELIFAIDDLLFRGRQVFTISASAFFYLGAWWILAASLFASRTGNRFAHVCAIFTAAILIAWPASTLVVGSPFQVQWTLVEFAGAAALLSLSLVSERGRIVYLALTIGCATAATYSSANGLFTWPVLVAAALLLRLRRSYVIALSASGAIAITLYFIGYQFPPGPSSLGLAFRHPLLFLGFVTNYLGVPFSVVSDRMGFIAGGAALAAFVGFAVAAQRWKLLGTRTGIVLFGFYLLVVLTAAMTALGRMDPINPAWFGGAKAHRYINVPLDGWAALTMIAGWMLGRLKSQIWMLPLALLLIGLFKIDRNPDVRSYMENPRASFFTSCQIASLSFESGLEDPEIMRTVLPNEDDVRKYLGIMRQNRLSIFASGRDQWVGKPAFSVFSSIYPRAEGGAITVAYPIEGGLELVGWSDFPRKIFDPEQLVFLNERREIIGLGSKIREDFPWGLGSLETPSSLAWIGFVNTSIPSTAIYTYKIADKGRLLVPVGRGLALESISNMKSVAGKRTGSALPPLDWQMEGSWRKNGKVLGEPDWDVPKGDVFDSWAGSDANTGKLVSSAFSAPRGCVIVPVTHGPSVSGLSVRVIDAATSATLGTISMLSSDGSWRYWRVRVPETAQQVKIVAEDQGRDWGQWLMLGEPRACE